VFTNILLVPLVVENLINPEVCLAAASASVGTAAFVVVFASVGSTSAVDTSVVGTIVAVLVSLDVPLGTGLLVVVVVVDLDIDVQDAVPGVVVLAFVQVVVLAFVQVVVLAFVQVVVLASGLVVALAFVLQDAAIFEVVVGQQGVVALGHEEP